MDTNICDKCGQNINNPIDTNKIVVALNEIKANAVQAEFALQERNEKIEENTVEVLTITQRIESAIGANMNSREALEAIQELQQRIKDKIIVEDRRAEELKKSESGDKQNG